LKTDIISRHEKIIILKIIFGDFNAVKQMRLRETKMGLKAEVSQVAVILTRILDYPGPGVCDIPKTVQANTVMKSMAVPYTFFAIHSALSSSHSIL
jgi:hypothetical protein